MPTAILSCIATSSNFHHFDDDFALTRLSCLFSIHRQLHFTNFTVFLSSPSLAPLFVSGPLRAERASPVDKPRYAANPNID
jgi:hypothetical protein